MTCPLCQRVYCDHSPFERSQTEREMMQDMNHDARTAVAKEWLRKLQRHHQGMYKHSLRVGELVRRVGAELGNPAPLNSLDLEHMGQLHDIGKLEIRVELLNRTSISPAEYEEIKRHTRVGYELLKEQHPYGACAAGKHHPTYAVPEYPAGMNELERKAVDEVMPLVTLCDFYDALMTRNNDAYRPVDKKNPYEVRAVLEKEFPAMAQEVHTLMTYFAGPDERQDQDRESEGGPSEEGGCALDHRGRRENMDWSIGDFAGDDDQYGEGHPQNSDRADFDLITLW